MYISPFDGRAYYDDTADEREERKTVPGRCCSECGAPFTGGAWFAGYDYWRGGEPLYRGYCDHCGGERRAKT